MGAEKAREDRRDEPRFQASRRDVLAAPTQEAREVFRVASTSLQTLPGSPGGYPAAAAAHSLEAAVAAVAIDDSQISLKAFRSPTPAPRPLGAQAKGPCALLARWEVVGGADKGGILVREGQSTSSKQLPDRLATGSIVEQLALQGERLNYRRLSGAGPETGWVSLSVSGKEIVTRRPQMPEDSFPLSCALSLQEELMDSYAKPQFQQALAEILREHPSKSGLQFFKKRNDLFLTVQSLVLPKYGFEGNSKGVVQMMSAYGPHGQCQEVAWNNEQLNQLLQL
ncbi:unnamed protein product [Polarella glacialis]|uniref:Protein C10 n=1 Tax=Polarella glacialis TaxID=89957 RepID=A0A813F036_POLGL|nr:unnamed protein product [Polarella glacialis]